MGINRLSKDGETEDKESGRGFGQQNGKERTSEQNEPASRMQKRRRKGREEKRPIALYSTMK